MFGKGVYFADMVTKSANYCFASKENSTGLMLLCEVALGEVNEKFYADYYANLLPEGKHSTKGCGRTAPKEGRMLGDVLVPCGEGAPTGSSGSLLYNEFIVYDVGQIKCRYLFRMRFNYQ
jgi:poly [ADP-ribose] polymerase